MCPKKILTIHLQPTIVPRTAEEFVIFQDELCLKKTDEIQKANKTHI